MKRRTLEENQSTVRTAVFEHYMETGKWCDVKTIAKRCDRSESWVRRTFDGVGTVPYIDVQKDARPSKIHGGCFEVGSHVVWVYAPSREYMRERLIAMQEGKASA